MEERDALLELEEERATLLECVAVMKRMKNYNKQLHYHGFIRKQVDLFMMHVWDLEAQISHHRSIKFQAELKKLNDAGVNDEEGFQIYVSLRKKRDKRYECIDMFTRVANDHSMSDDELAKVERALNALNEMNHAIAVLEPLYGERWKKSSNK
jgi:hypothetical protein